LQPRVVDAQTIVEENRRNDEQRTALQATIEVQQRELDALHKALSRELFGDRVPAAEGVAASTNEGNLVSQQKLLAALSPQQRAAHERLVQAIADTKEALSQVPPPKDPALAQQKAQEWFDDDIRRKMRSRTFVRESLTDPRYGGVITTAAVLSMTSGPQRTHPIARGAWMIEVILNDPPAPPPNDVPPLNEEASDKQLTIREKFAAHRENPNCAGCHSRLDPLGFALENFDITGRWRNQYENGRDVDASGELMKKHAFADVVQFKQSLVKERRRFAKAFTAHLLRYALSRELAAADSITIESVIDKTEKDSFKIRALMRAVIASDAFAAVGE
jgi:hypothetical protein